MNKAKTKPFDPAEYLDDSESIAAYLTDALESEDPAFVADALGVVARARGMSEVARKAGVSRKPLSRSKRRRQPGVRDHPARGASLGVATLCRAVTAKEIRLNSRCPKVPTLRPRPNSRPARTALPKPGSHHRRSAGQVRAIEKWPNRMQDKIPALIRPKGAESNSALPFKRDHAALSIPIE
jgi:probable addiction module antidote protein